MSELRAYSFGSFRLLPAERLLTREGEPISLTPKVFDTLVLLIERRGRLVEKDELMTLLWPDVVVDENNLNKNVSVLRKALGNGSGEPYIETVPKRGYRFIAEVRTDPPFAGGRPREAVRPDRMPPFLVFGWFAIIAIAAVVVLTVAFHPGERSKPDLRQIHSIAVLPFRRIDGAATSNYVGLALADSLIDRLGYARTFQVRPTSSIQRYADGRTDALAAAKELGVDGVVEGTIQQSGGRTRITVELISAALRTPVWTGRFDDSTNDVFALEDLVGGAVARALSTGGVVPAWGRHRPPPDAYDAYLRGRYYLSARGPEDISNALVAYQQAVARDPEFAAGYAGEAESLVLMSLYRIRPPSESFPLAKAAATRALKLDPSLAEAHACLGAVSFYYDHDASAAERELQRAIALKPQYGTARRWYANYLTARGRFDDAIAQIRVAQAADPQSLMLRSVLGWHLFMARRYGEAIVQLQRTLDIDSTFVPAIHSLALAYMKRSAMTRRRRCSTRKRSWPASRT